MREVNLLGQNVNAYRGPLDDGETADLALLIEHVAAIPGIARIRYTTSHPGGIFRPADRVYARVPQLVSHLHLPVQSGSDRILALMKRGHTALEYKAKVRKAARRAPGDQPVLGLHRRVSRRDRAATFAATMALIEEIGFDHSFSFVYSARPGTPAASLPDPTPLAVKKSGWPGCRRGSKLARATSAGA